MTNEREFLEWHCWVKATEAEGFYPPDKTAKRCMASLPEDKYNHGEEYERALGWEEGQHYRAWTNAVTFYISLHRQGFDPVEMAQTEIKRARSEGLYLDDIDWTWLQESGYEGEIE